MKASELARLVQWLDAAGILAFEVKEPGRCIRVVMHGRGGAGVARGTGAGGPAGTTTQDTAPARGIFRATHPLRQGLLAEVGQTVAPGDILGLIQVDEVLYRPVRAARPGRVSRCWAADGEHIEEGAPLFDITTGGD